MAHESQPVPDDAAFGAAEPPLPLIACAGDLAAVDSSRQDHLWRKEVVNRVAGYRNRRSRKALAGRFSMRFNFEAAPVISSEPEPKLAPRGVTPGEMTGAMDVQAAFPPLPAHGSLEAPLERSAAVEPAPAPAMAGEHARVLQFPRPMSFEALPGFFDWEPSPAPHQLAEPVFHKPRIIDVPETIVVAPPALADIAMPAAKDDEDEPVPTDFDLPPQAAPLSRRLAAALTDLLLIFVATVAFMLIVMHGHPSLRGEPVAQGFFSKSMLALILPAPLLFWTAYHYLFLVHGAATPGMSLAHLLISTFDGKPVRRAVRRWRVLLMVLSCASLGLGFFWALFDQDALCWHDRMTRTCVTTAPEVSSSAVAGR